jgi:hypothetical protein
LVIKSCQSTNLWNTKKNCSAEQELKQISNKHPTRNNTLNGTEENMSYAIMLRQSIRSIQRSFGPTHIT